MDLKFEVVSKDKTPRFSTTGYTAAIDALRTLPVDKAILIIVPGDFDPRTYRNALANAAKVRGIAVATSIKKGTRELYVWNRLAKKKA